MQQPTQGAPSATMSVQRLENTRTDQKLNTLRPLLHRCPQRDLFIYC